MAFWVACQGACSTLHRRLVGCRLASFPAKAHLIGHRKAQQVMGRCIGGVDRQGPFKFEARLCMSVPGKIVVEGMALEEMLVDQWAARAFAPHPHLFTKRQPDLERGSDVL